ncbi:hypothetical protein GCM10023093_24450 [Nemorincola caseinilytica]|uniref:Tetratricopeptide repeat protein n=1 Tax=Nemorincola caseinilytica TaxID=2054315 RepID=A0ABP8NIG4_9BACT
MSLFLQEMVGNDGLSMFYFTYSFLNGGIGEGDRLRNANEWSTYTWGAARPADIDTVMYNVPGYEFVDAYANNDWGRLRQNTFIQWLLLPQNKKAMDYMLFAKKVELAHSRWTQDEQNLWKWRIVDVGMDREGEYFLIKDAMVLCENADVAQFLRQRYAFQAVKMMYYENYYSTDTVICDADGGTKDNTPLIQCYERYLKDRPTIVAKWGRLYYGLSFADKRKRAAELIRCFHRCDEKKDFIYKHLSAGEVNDLLATEKNKEMRAAIYAYKGIKTPGKAMAEIKAVYENAPGSDYLGLLMVREISKLDNWVLGPEVNGFYSGSDRGSDWYDHGDTLARFFALKNLAKDKVYMRQLMSCLEGLRDLRGKNATLRMLALAHLHQVDKNFAMAATYLDKIPRQKDRTIEQQRNVERIIHIMNTEDIAAGTVQQKLYEHFAVLDVVKKEAGYWDYYYPPVDVRSELYLMLSGKFRKKGDIVMAHLLFRKADMQVNDHCGYNPPGEDDTEFRYHYIHHLDRYGRPEDVDSLLAFYDKKGKTAFERSVMPERRGKNEWYAELKGTLLMRQGKFEEALAVYSNLPENYWAENYEFKIYLDRLNITAGGTLLPEPETMPRYYDMVSKKYALQDIVRLRKQLQTEKDSTKVARICFQLGNAFYNMSYYGRDWMMYSYGWSSHENDVYDVNGKWEYFRFRSADPVIEKVYYNCTWAIKMYEKALVNARKDKELGAKIVMMLALCDDGDRYYKFIKKMERSDLYPPFERPKDLTSPYLSLLGKRYSRTRTYEWASVNCPDIAGY